MNTKLKNYLFRKFPKLYKSEIPILCENGWFPLIVSTSRFLQTYFDQQNIASQNNPLKYESVLQQEILKISKNNFGFLEIDVKNSNDHIKSFIKFIEYISGNVCEKTSSFFNNVCLITQSSKTICNQKFVTNQEYYYIDNEELRIIINEVFGENENKDQLEFNF